MNTGATDAAVGMMDGAYFTSRKDLLDFFNNLLSMNLGKIEQTATGAVACQLMDYIFPGTIPMKRVNWEARSDFQFIENYKLLQACFTKNRIQKHVDVDRLIRAKYQDNLEFCQWLKAFYEQASPSYREDYDPVQRRHLGKGGKNLDIIFLPRGAAGSGGSSNSMAPPIPRKPKSNVRQSNVFGDSAKKKQTKSFDSVSGGGSVASKKSYSNKPVKSFGDRNDADLTKKNMELKKKNAELELSLNGTEHERDFYFDKLRGIEVMLQVHEEKGEESDPIELISRIFKVLYAKLEDNVVVNDDGELIENAENGTFVENIPPQNVASESDDMLDDSLLTMEDE